MTKLIALRLDKDLLDFIDSMNEIPTRTDRIKGIIAWLEEYQTTYLPSIIDYIKNRITNESHGS